MNNQDLAIILITTITLLIGLCIYATEEYNNTLRGIIIITISIFTLAFYFYPSKGKKELKDEEKR